MALQRSLWRIKAGLESRGYPVGDPIAPLAPLSQEERAMVAAVLAECSS